MSARERASFTARERARAHLLLEEKARAHESDPEDAERTTLAAMLPSYDQGELRFTLVMTSPAPRADSDREWNEYTFATQIQSETSLAVFAPFATVPDPVAAFAARQADFRMAGFSEIEEDASRGRRAANLPGRR